MKKSLLTGRTIYERGLEWLYFAGTSYLGISHHPDFRKLLGEGMDLFGVNYGGSRHSNIQLNVFDQAEAFLAKWIGSSSVMVTSSGTLAGQLLIQSIQMQYQLIYSPHTHTALHLGPRSYYQDWPNKLIDEIEKHPHLPVAILSNAVDPLTANYLDFSWIADLPRRKDLLLIIDDSHGIGVLGNNGSGIYDYIRSQTEIDLVTLGSLGKALGVPAGFIAGPGPLIKNCFDHPLFIGSSAPPPAYLYAMINSKTIYDDQLYKLIKNISLFTNSCQSIQKFKFLPEYPVFYINDDRLYAYLNKHRIICSSFSYPNINSPALTRLVVNALHTPDDIKRLAQTVDNYFI